MLPLVQVLVFVLHLAFGGVTSKFIARNRTTEPFGPKQWRVELTVHVYFFLLTTSNTSFYF